MRDRRMEQYMNIRGAEILGKLALGKGHIYTSSHKQIRRDRECVPATSCLHIKAAGTELC